MLGSASATIAAIHSDAHDSCADILRKGFQRKLWPTQILNKVKWSRRGGSKWVTVGCDPEFIFTSFHRWLFSPSASQTLIERWMMSGERPLGMCCMCTNPGALNVIRSSPRRSFGEFSPVITSLLFLGCWSSQKSSPRQKEEAGQLVSVTLPLHLVNSNPRVFQNAVW